MTARRLFPLALTMLLAACATPSAYPSLAIRDAERVKGAFGPPDTGTPAPVVAPPAPSAELTARLAQLQDQAQAAHREFVSAVPAAERLANGAGAVGSDSWASAQVALADLDSSRSKAAVALSELDILFIDATIDATRREAIGAARDSVVALVGQEDAVLARLRR